MKRSIQSIFFVVFAIVSLYSCDKSTKEIEVAVTSVTLNQPTAEMFIGETLQLKASISPSNATDKVVLWGSSKQSVATVSNSGVVTAVSEGISTITASVGAKSATCMVTVSKSYVAVASITIGETEIILNKGESTVLSATVLPADASNTTVTWSSSDISIVDVDQSGKITAKSGGSAIITAKAENHTATCSVTVVVPVTKITLEDETLVLEEGNSATLTAIIEPIDATDKTMSWTSSDDNVAKVDQEGHVEAVKEGECTIMVKAGEMNATCQVIVNKKVIAVESIILNKTTLTLTKGSSEVLVATLKPDDATNKSVTWISSDPTVASVDQEGLVTAVAGGETTITAKNGEVKAQCHVLVTVSVESVILDKTEVKVFEGESIKLSAMVKPDDATDKTIAWGSSDEAIATVDDSGLVNGINAGKTSIVAIAGGKMASCEVTVEIDMSNQAIVFNDSKIKEKLVSSFDLNGDGELSYKEASSITSGVSLKEAFQGEYSFNSFNEFQYFTGITVIPDYMFEKWTIESIVLPPSITTIGQRAFIECSLLENITIPSEVKEIPNRCFYGCSSLSNVRLPEKLDLISFQAFYGCSNLVSIEIPSNTTKIFAEAFYLCTSLSKITLSDSLSFIEYGVFSNCYSLKSISIPPSVTLLDSGLFYNCTSLETILLPDSIVKIKNSVFSGCTSLETIALPASVKDIEYGVFSGCKKLKTVTLPKNLGGELAHNLFYNCESLKNIEIPENITKISDRAFFGCNSLETIKLPDIVVSIGWQAFALCKSLSEIEIPERVKEIWELAFSNCSGLKKIIIRPELVPNALIGSSSTQWNAFLKTNDCPIYVPASSLEQYKTADQWSKYSDRIFAFDGAVDLGLSVK